MFTVATVMCALSMSGAELDAWRVVQGMGAAMILANSGAIITDVYPPWERGKAFGYWTLAVYTGTTVGPVLGGAITTLRAIAGVQSWRWVFLVTVPLALTGYLLSQAYLKESVGQPGQPIDATGGALAAVGVAASLFGLTAASFEGWSPPYLALLAIGVALIAAFVAWEARLGPLALLDVGLFRSVQFSMGNLAALLNYAGYFFVPFFLSYYMIVVLGMRPIEASLALLSLSLAMVVLAPISGRLSDRVGARPLATAGMMLIALGLLLLIPLGLRATLADVTWRALIIGVGMGLFSSPNSASVMGAAPRERLAVASATLSLMRFYGQSLSLALASSLAATYIPRPVLVSVFTGLPVSAAASALDFIRGVRLVYEVMVILVIVGAIASAMRGRESGA
ncbi:MAG: Major Facilitator Superfamily [uncultured Acidilobus sp. CIS]|nr:MAG: Major Facilitator Superfamily [uncultured Acidilobus sp. CIS]